MSANSTKQQIGLFGGSFNPPHVGHLRLATAASNTLALDQLWWIPTAHPAHRLEPKVSFEHRANMAELMTQGNPSWYLSKIEGQNNGPSFFINTLHYFIEQKPNAAFYILMGDDQLQQFDQWHKWEQIIELATLVVMDRNKKDTRSLNSTLQQALLETILDRLILLQEQPITVSSSYIRDHSLESGIEQKVIEPVYAYMQQHQLYNSQDG